MSRGRRYLPMLNAAIEISSSANNMQAKDNLNTNIPNHVGFICDGNGRWAHSRGIERHFGHSAGANTTVEIAKRSFDVGVKVVTLYLFSTENWARPQVEVSTIMSLLEKYLVEVSQYLLQNEIRLVAIGQLSRLPQSCQALINRLTSDTSKKGSQRTLCLALSYGGRDDIVQACRSIVSARSAIAPGEIDESLFSKHTSTGRLGIPDPDLIIRTSGEMRISNFLLWQSAYTEFASVDKLWPDFTPDEAEHIIITYANRERRFGR